MKLSTALESQLRNSKINLVLDDRVKIPSSGSINDPSEWDGSSGYLGQVKTVKLASGKTLKADLVFVSIGNRPNVSLVKSVDPQALSDGLIAVDEYLKVSSYAEY